MNLQDETVAAGLMDSSVPTLLQTDEQDGPGGSGGPSGPSGPIDIVFSFDTTGYMYGCIAELKKRIQEVNVESKCNYHVCCSMFNVSSNKFHCMHRG